MNQPSKYQVWLPLLFGLVAALGLLTGYQLAGNAPGQRLGAKRTNALQEAIDLLQYKYVDSLPTDSLMADGLQAVLGHLDPHSVYIPPQEIEAVNADLSGGFFGIGVEYQMINDTMNLVYIMEGGPSDKAGLQAGDMIVSVDKVPVAGVKMKAEDIRKKIRGNNNTSVTVGLLRNGKPLSATITRGNIPLPSLDAAYMAAAGIGYIRLNKFAETTYKEFMEAATGLQKQGMTRLILDLRGNGGGLMQEATNIADELLEDGLKLVTTRGLHTKERTISSNKPGILEEAPVVVLIDDFSASASEVLAGSLQDNDRGTIMGRRSFGKGLVQEQYNLSNGGALRLTVARYYTPTGRSIQKPYSGDLNAYHEEIVNRFAKPDTMPANAQVFTTRKGKKLYGNGGITPDVALEADTARLGNSPERLLYSPNLISRFAFDLFKQYQPQVRAYKTAEDFQKGFQLQAADWNHLLNLAQKDSLAVQVISEAAKADLALRTKANMARLVWRNNGFFTVLKTQDKYLAAAIAHLQNQKTEAKKP